jgi:hypothetical protein
MFISNSKSGLIAFCLLQEDTMRRYGPGLPSIENQAKGIVPGCDGTTYFHSSSASRVNSFAMMHDRDRHVT